MFIKSLPFRIFAYCIWAANFFLGIIYSIITVLDIVNGLDIVLVLIHLGCALGNIIAVYLAVSNIIKSRKLK